MYPELSVEAKALRGQLRAYFADLINDEDRAALREQNEGGPTFDRLLRKMGSDGWLGLGWPKEYGGQGEDPEALFVFYDEAIRADAPLSMVSLNTVAPALMKHGSEQQKSFFLPKILAGELNFAIGYTEPSAGSDLANLKTRAEIDGDSFVINGSKVFTSGGMFADWIWLACRTDPDAVRHRGISIITVPTATPGFSVTPIETIGDHSTSATYYEDVRVPITNLVGELHGGWKLITDQLNHERVALAARGGIANELFDEVLRWARQTPAGPGTAYDIPWVRSHLARAYSLLSASDLYNLRLVSKVANNTLTGADGAGAKVVGTETVVAVYDLLQQVMGVAGLLRAGTPAVELDGRIEWMGRRGQNNTFGGGTNEIMRDLVAAGALGMTVRARRSDTPQRTKER